MLRCFARVVSWGKSEIVLRRTVILQGSQKRLQTGGTAGLGVGRQLGVARQLTVLSNCHQKVMLQVLILNRVNSFCQTLYTTFNSSMANIPIQQQNSSGYLYVFSNSTNFSWKTHKGTQAKEAAPGLVCFGNCKHFGMARVQGYSKR